MLNSLMVPLDGSTLSEHSLPLALAVGRATGAKLHLVSVNDSEDPDMEAWEQSERVDERTYQSHYLQLIERKVRNGEVRVDSTVLDGPIADRLVGYGEKVHADTIVMTTHGRTGVSRMWFGSVADRLVRQTELPVLLIHPGESGLWRDQPEVEHIVVGLDGSLHAEAVLAPAVEWAKALDAKLTLVRIVPTDAAIGAHFLPLSGYLNLARAAEEYLDRVAGSLADEGIPVRVKVRTARHPAHALIRATQDLGGDMIAVSTHGRSGIKRGILGSTVDKVLRSSPVPILVQRA